MGCDTGRSSKGQNPELETAACPELMLVICQNQMTPWTQLRITVLERTTLSESNDSLDVVAYYSLLP